MKTHLVLGLAVLSVALLGSCKSQESAYRQAYEKAKAQQVSTSTDETTTVQVAPRTETKTEETVTVTPVTSTTSTAVDHSDVRTIEGGVTVVNGDKLLAYSVVVGSFLTQANAEGLMNTLKNKGYASRVVKTNETINGHTGWFRVIASSFNDKASATQSRDELKGTYAGAWLLYNK